MLPRNLTEKSFARNENLCKALIRYLNLPFKIEFDNNFIWECNELISVAYIVSPHFWIKIREKTSVHADSIRFIKRGCEIHYTGKLGNKNMSSFDVVDCPDPDFDNLPKHYTASTPVYRLMRDIKQTIEDRMTLCINVQILQTS